MREAARREPGRFAASEFDAPEGDGIVSRLTDLIMANPARSAALVVMTLTGLAIVSNAAFLQTSRHPDPFFATRIAEKPAAAAADTGTVPIPKSRADAASAPVLNADQALVADTQRALANAHLYDGPVDGLMGPQTRNAIVAFEKRLGVTPTGQASARLLAQIRKGAGRAADPATTGAVLSTADQARLKKVQTALNAIGYGPVDVDGRPGEKTTTAIRRFELDNGLPLTGAPGPAVLAKLVMLGAPVTP